MSTDSFNISLPGSLGDFVVSQSQQQGFGTPDEYVRFLLEEQQRKALQRLENQLDAAVASGPAAEYTPQQWQDTRRAIIQKLGLPETP